MIDRIKGWLNSALAPIALFLAFAWYMLTQNRKLKEQLTETKAEGSLKETEGRQDEIDKQATSAVADYNAIREQVLRGDPTDPHAGG